ncbi:MAG: ubiquinol-cytochrome c reductase iron-sulfur subunit [Anaerolineales bacterium]|nr:ubiquinol-cytochrome c reductase iron-sulfur subunit [Chloroflexota bacterium]MBL6982880.1 ubiquinol-cytochrome c reductase iron-sulfur subunit [Anaerolineales bacterium]
MTEETIEPRTPVNRREFLNLAWLATLGFFFVDIAGVTYFFAMPRFREGEFGGLFTIGKLSELPTLGSAPVNFPKVKLWLANTEEGIKAIYKVCTHLGCLYSWSDQEVKFICPCHGSQFDSDGSYIQGPAPRDLDIFVVQAVDPDTGEVVAETPADGSALSIPEGKDYLIRVDTGSKINGQPHS